MKEKLSEWIYKKNSVESVVDVTAQLLKNNCISKHILSPENIEVMISDNDDFAELIFNKPLDEYSSFFRPLTDEPTETGNVFSTGLLLYVMLTGSKPDISNAELLLVAAADGGSHPLLSLKTSSLNELIERMTDVNPDKRITSYEALDFLAKKYTGTGVINLIENDSGAKINSIEVSLDMAETIWKVPQSFVYDEQEFFPLELKPLNFPFRIKTAEYDFKVTLKSSHKAFKYNVKGNDQKKYFGIDIGEHYVNISCLASDGKMSDNALIIKSTAASENENNCIFGQEAEELCKNSYAQKIKFLSDDLQSGTQFNITDSSGNSMHISAESIVSYFFMYIKKQLTELYEYSENDSVTLTFSGGSSSIRKEILLNAAEKCGISPLCISAVSAAELSCYEENPCDKYIMQVNSGAVSTDICIFKETLHTGTAYKPEMFEKSGFSTSGGNDMTAVIFNSLLHKVNQSCNINMYNKELSGLSFSHYMKNHAELMNASERIKHKLTFEEKATEKIRLYTDSVRTAEVSLTVLRKEYENLLIPIMNKIKCTIENCLNNEQCHKENIGIVILSGGTAFTPSFRKLFDSYFSGTECHVLHMMYDSSLLSRGAALYGCISEKSSNHTSSADKDFGIVICDISRGIPVFRRIISAGTPFTDGIIDFPAYDYEVNSKEMLSDFCELKLYTRKKGMEHIEYTYDGDAIRYFGKVRFKLPDGFNNETERIRLEISMDILQKITVKASLIRRNGSFSLFLKKITKQDSEEWKICKNTITAEFLES
ncbi:MAG: Hsp70 family protein [Ruminococcus flavefaciens]|nr:Hsp70 family protein [Ruminococcus flavefaciens]